MSAPREWRPENVLQAELVRDLLTNHTEAAICPPADKHQASQEILLLLLLTRHHSEGYLVGADSDNMLYVWSLDSGSQLLSLDYSQCQLDRIFTTSSRHQDFLLVYHNMSEPLNRLHVFEVNSN